MQIIITVDDVGIHPAVSRSIKILSSMGIATSASVVANGMCVEDAKTLAGVSVGVQLETLRGRPVGHWQDRKTLVDENGMFLKNASKLFQLYVLGKLDHTHVEKEWEDQIEKVLDLGIQVTHLSSTGNIHAWPTLTRMAGELASRYGIKWIRKPEECHDISKLDKGNVKAKFLNVCGLFSRGTDGVDWSDRVWGVTEQGDALTADNFYAYMTKANRAEEDAEIVEICCRPGVTEAGDPPIPSEFDPTSIAPIWLSEHESLVNGDWRNVFEKLGARLTSFSSLQAKS